MKKPLKKPLPKLLAAAGAALALAVLCLEPFPWSGSAAADLTEAMEALHGPAYAGREIPAAGEDGAPVSLREDLAYSVEPASPLVPRDWLAGLLGWERTYVCRAVFTRSLAGEDGDLVQTRVWTCAGRDDGDPGSPLRARLLEDTAAWTCPDGGELFQLPAGAPPAGSLNLF